MSHISTAIKALERQIVKYNVELEELTRKEMDITDAIAFYKEAVIKLQAQINALKGPEVLEKLPVEEKPLI